MTYHNVHANPREVSVIYWCQQCDARRVDSQDPTTGKFFHQFGHQFGTEDYTSVYYALCPTCLDLPRKGIHED